MKKLGAKSRPSTEFSASAMSDIAFLLLIFFLVTTIFALERGIPMLLPGQKSDNVKVKRKNIMTVKAYANGSVTIDDDPVKVSGIRPIVEERLARNDKTIIVIETHPDSEYGLMVDILDELRLAKARTISLRTMAGGG
ncbi:MAG: biopolymer transporter ExbD [Candidatus Krumholzibacteria bacterium]|nr:biopolymer transporter ExbD [Candidatus Krumholzibacteria bacterium]